MVCGCIYSVFVGWRDVALERTRNKRAMQEFKKNVGANLVNDAIPRKDQFALCHKITLTLNEWLPDITDWLINLLIESVNYWLVIWRNVWQAGWFPTNWLIDQSSRPSDWLNDQLTDRLTYGQTDWLTDVLTLRVKISITYLPFPIASIPDSFQDLSAIRNASMYLLGMFVRRILMCYSDNWDLNRYAYIRPSLRDCAMVFSK